jgi:CRISPR-associated protein Csb2
VIWRQSQTVAAWLRHQAAIELGSELPADVIASFVQGHVDAGADKSQCLSYLAIPSVTGPYPDGLIRRVLVCEPPESDGRVAQILERRMAGAVLTSEEGVEEAVLAPPDGRDDVLYRYQKPSSVWRSVTPVILHGYNSKSGRISIAKTERLLLRAFAMAGYDEGHVTGLAFQAAPFWRGCGHAREIRVPKHLDGFPRLHVQVAFRSHVSGPVLAGIGQHYGIGLFAAV